MGRMECVTPIPRSKQSAELTDLSIWHLSAEPKHQGLKIMEPSGDGNLNLPVLPSAPPSEPFLCHLLQVPVTSILTKASFVLF